MSRRTGAALAESMRRFGSMIWTAWCVVFVPLAAIIDGIFAWPALVAWYLIHGRPFDSATRVYNQHFGRVVVGASWPLVRVWRRGFENMPDRPCLIVINHRSFCDILLCSLLPYQRCVVFVRSWPFRMWPLGYFMRMAGYKDIESMSIEELIEGDGRRHLALGENFLFFPEGHRSRTGRLQRFRLGAFVMASRYGLPVVPVCISGTERLMRRRPWVSPIRVTMTMLPPVESVDFDGKDGPIRLRNHVQQIYRDFFGEND